MKKVILTLSITFQGPVISGDSKAGEFGVDLPFHKNANNEKIVPYSQIKGRLLESLNTLKDMIGVTDTEITDWLGKKSDESSHNTPSRGRLIFSDFIFQEPGDADVRTRIRIDEKTLATKKGAYLVVETPYKPGSVAQCKGDIRFFSGDDQEIEKIVSTLKKSFRWTSSLGGLRTTGYGAVRDIIIEKQSEVSFEPKASYSGSFDYCQIDITPENCFCIAGQRKADNLFETEKIIPGSAIKGSVASTINALLQRPIDSYLDASLPSPWKELGEHFSEIRFSHAFPAKAGGNRPAAYPLSIVRAPETPASNQSKTFDVILKERPGLINEAAPFFSSDWKRRDFEDAARDLGWGNFPSTTTRVRIQMDSGKRRVDEGNLFAYKMVNPEDFVWKGVVDLSLVPEAKRGAIDSILAQLLEFGVEYLGKTKTGFRASLTSAAPPPAPAPLSTGEWVVTLQTPALMIRPDAGLNQAFKEPSILFAAYDDFWKKISSDKLRLKRFFAEQKLEGGYLHFRFQPNKPYNPFLLTAERSVFVLEADSQNVQAAKTDLEQWLRRGLPIPAWAVENYGASSGVLDWRTWPYTKENGFGEIAVNLDCHSQLEPKPHEFKGV